MKRVLFFCMLVGSLSLSAQNTEKYEALFIINFIKHIEWTDGQKIRIGVLGNSRVLSELNVFINKNKYDFEAKKVAYLDEVSKYELVYIPKSQNKSVVSILEKTAQSKTILIAQDAEFASKVIFSFFVEGNKLRFNYNRGMADKKGLKISSELLKYANVIE